MNGNIAQKIVRNRVVFWGHFDNPLFDRNRTEPCSQKGETYEIVLYRIYHTYLQ